MAFAVLVLVVKGGRVSGGGGGGGGSCGDSGRGASAGWLVRW